MTLLAALEGAAADLAGAERLERDGAVEWTVAQTVFAAFRGATAEFRLQPAVARAALGTPSTGPSPRGPDWVAFAPTEVDRFALDRATAWLASAYRTATAASPSRSPRAPRRP